MKYSIKKIIVCFSFITACVWGLWGEPSVVEAQLTPDVTIDTTSSAAGIALIADQVYQINPDVTYTLTAAITGDFTLTKIGTGTMQLNATGNSALVVNEGNVILSGQNSVARFSKGLTINTGAVVTCISKDTFGYEKTSAGASQNIYIYGGILDKNYTATDNNETLGYVNFYLKGGTMSATSGYYDVLRPETMFYSQAADDATAENPTESLISAQLNIRTNYMGTTGSTFDSAANSVLTISGQITGGLASEPSFQKTGAGTLVLSNSGNSYAGATLLKEGTLKLSGTGKLGTGALTISDGATLEIGSTTAVSSAYTFTGAGVGGLGAIRFTAAGSISGAGTLAGDGTISVAEGITATLSNAVAGTGTLTKIGTGILDITELQTGFSGNLVINEGTVQLSKACGQTGIFTAGNTITINTGAKLVMNASDCLGYTSGNPDMIYINGGTFTSGASAHYSVGNFTLTNGSILDDGHKDASNLSYIFDGKITVNAGTSYLTTTGNVQYRAKLNADKQVIFDVKEGGNFIVNASFVSSESATLHKTGAGTMTFTSAGTKVSTGSLYIDEGKVLMQLIGDSHRWNGNIYIAQGATLESEHDGLGYGTSGTTNLYIAGTWQTPTDSNETLRNDNLFLQGGVVKGGSLHVLNANVQLNSLALEGATAENPTVSTIQNSLRYRNATKDTNSMTFTTAENSVLRLEGFVESEFSGDITVHKKGAGELVFSNANNAMSSFNLTVDEGSLKIENNALKTVKSITMAAGTYFDQGADALTIGTLNFGATDTIAVTNDGSDYATITGNVLFTDGATFALTSDMPLDYLDFYSSAVTLMESNHEFSGLDEVALDISGLKMNLPDGYGFHVEQMSNGGMYYLSAVMNAPEPAAWVLMTFGMLFIGNTLRKTKMKKS